MFFPPSKKKRIFFFHEKSSFSVKFNRTFSLKIFWVQIILLYESSNTI